MMLPEVSDSVEVGLDLDLDVDLDEDMDDLDLTDTECLGSMTPETQEIYLRLDHHRRRSGLRLARLIARQQLLRKIVQGTRQIMVRVPPGCLAY